MSVLIPTKQKWEFNIMTLYTYKKIVANARTIKKQVENEYDYTLTDNWVYYLCKALIKPNKDVNGFGIAKPNKPSGDYISRGINKTNYLDMCNRVCKFVENNKKIPNYVTYKNIRVNIRLWCYITAYLLVHYVDDKGLKSVVNVNSKYFVKPTESKNAVFDYFVKKTGYTPKSIDDFCNYVLKHYTYEYYYDDRKSNKEVIDSRAGNCTDLSQLAVNMGEALGYEWEAIHTRCNVSGAGHIYTRFKRKGSSVGWFTRDCACISDESRFCVWCDVNDGGSLIAKNPYWFLSNLHR